MRRQTPKNLNSEPNMIINFLSLSWLGWRSQVCGGLAGVLCRDERHRVPSSLSPVLPGNYFLVVRLPVSGCSGSAVGTSLTGLFPNEIRPTLSFPSHHTTAPHLVSEMGRCVGARGQKYSTSTSLSSS